MSAKRILVVEDVEDNRRIMHDLLTSAGFEFIEARRRSIRRSPSRASTIPISS